MSSNVWNTQKVGVVLGLGCSARVYWYSTVTKTVYLTTHPESWRWVQNKLQLQTMTWNMSWLLPTCQVIVSVKLLDKWFCFHSYSFVRFGMCRAGWLTDCGYAILYGENNKIWVVCMGRAGWICGDSLWIQLTEGKTESHKFLIVYFISLDNYIVLVFFIIGDCM